MKVVVAGAGIAGLAAAWELTQNGGHEVLVLESERRAGGAIVTELRDGCLIEGGPDGFLGGEPELPQLANELGIGEHIVRQNARGTSLWNGVELSPIDDGKAAALLGIDAPLSQVAKGFRSFAAGMGELVAALTERLGGASVRYAQGVAGLIPDGKGWRIPITGGSTHDADAVVLALPAYSAGRLLEAAGVPHARALADVVYAPSVTVSLVYPDMHLSNRLEGAGFVVESPKQLRACTYASAKFPRRAPPGHVLLRAYLAPGDDNPAQVAHAELTTILGIRGEPLWSRVFYWNRGLPRYRAHHAEHVADVRERLKRLPPLAIAGAGYDGAGVSACVRSGRAAGHLIAQLTAR